MEQMPLGGRISSSTSTGAGSRMGIGYGVDKAVGSDGLSGPTGAGDITLESCSSSSTTGRSSAGSRGRP